jgi:hypothetical protein
MNLPRRRFLHLAAGAAALPATSRISWAQAYPARPVRIIVGFAAAGRSVSWVKFRPPCHWRVGALAFTASAPALA